MISHEHQCIFIHIPKCAGSSIEKVLGHFDDYNGRERQDHRSVRMIQQPFSVIDALSSKENFKDLIRRYREGFREQKNPRNAYTVNKAQYADYFKFTVVRNPWDRLYSWYKNVKRDEVHQKNYAIPADISFLSFLEKFAGTGYLRPQTYWLQQFNGELNLDFIGKFEDLPAVLTTIKSQLSLPETLTLPHEVHGSKPNKSPSYSQQEIDFISEYYAEEINLFSYEAPIAS